MTPPWLENAWLAPTKYLYFEQANNPGRKTGVWRVRARSTGAELGVIRWYSPWRQYCFYSAPSAIFNTDCLISICDRIETCNRWQRNVRANLAATKTEVMA